MRSPGEKVHLDKRHELRTEFQGFLPLNIIQTMFFDYEAIEKALEYKTTFQDHDLICFFFFLLPTFVETGANQLTFLGLNFIICKMKIKLYQCFCSVIIIIFLIRL